MAPAKRRNVFLEVYEHEFDRINVFLKVYAHEFDGIKKSKKGDEYAFCVVCNCEICLTATGKTAISNHQKTDKHQKAAKAANTTRAIKNFHASIPAPKNIDKQTAAAEGNIFFIF
jgi:hypothetical protein